MNPSPEGDRRDDVGVHVGKLLRARRKQIKDGGCIKFSTYVTLGLKNKQQVGNPPNIYIREMENVHYLYLRLSFLASGEQL